MGDRVSVMFVCVVGYRVFSVHSCTLRVVDDWAWCVYVYGRRFVQ